MMKKYDKKRNHKPAAPVNNRPNIKNDVVNRDGKFTVSPESVRMIDLEHPWIIADSYTKRWPEPPAGTMIDLSDGTKKVATALIDPGKRTVARIIHFGPERPKKDWLETRLISAITLRDNQLLFSGKSNVYRLINAEGDFLPGLTIDRYGNYAMIQLFSESWVPFLNQITTLLMDKCSLTGVYVKGRPQETRALEAKRKDQNKSKNLSQLLAGEKAPRPLIVQENGLNYQVDLDEGLDSGIFPDHRETRQWVSSRAEDKRVLNLFSYTCSFSVVAAMAGAREVTSIDVSKHYLERGKANFKLNNLEANDYRWIADDCINALSRLKESDETFDLIILDPPSFSTTKKGRFSTKGGTSDLIAAVMPLLASGGTLIASSNHQKTDLVDYLKEIRRGAIKAGAELSIISTTGQPADFPYSVTCPESRYLKIVTAVKR